MISCRGLTKHFGNECVIENYSVDFPPSGFSLLLGESGSGKTTFLNLLAGFLQPDSGSVYLNGRIIGTDGESSPPEGIDYITQDTFFVDFLTAEENLQLLGASEQTIRAMMERFGLKDRLAAYPPTLSGGERARLALVRSLLKGKTILLLDEPTAALDEGNKRQVFEILADLGKQVLILCASHDAEAIPFADMIIHFSKDDPTPVTEIRKKKASAETTTSVNPLPVRTSALPSLKPYVNRWFGSDRREKRSRPLFFVFLVLSFLFLLFADTPTHKLSATCRSTFRINAMHLSLDEGLMLKDLPLDLTDVTEIVLHYRDTCPFEGQVFNAASGAILRYDRSFITLPAQEENFAIVSALAAGTYYTAPNQTIISYEMAELLSPGAPEKLIGTTMTRTLYRYGSVTLTVVGVFRKMNLSELAYLNACGADYDLMQFNPEGYRNVFFINSALVNELLDDESFYRDNKHRSCFLFFPSYSALTRFTEQSKEILTETKNLTAQVEMPGDLPYRVDAHSRLLLPLAVLVSVFTVLFYAELNKTEFLYNHDFVSAFEYSGYSKKTVIKMLIRGAAAEFLKLLIIACAAGSIIALLVNALNHCYGWFYLELFSIEPWLMAVWLFLTVMLSLLFLVVRFRKVKVVSWYENMIDTRDVL